jgi:aspartyl-tRNA(Asn)/glutamyl-tRNA(Gln) amidotransferase subunit A
MTYENSSKSIAQLAVLLQSGQLDARALAEETLDSVRAHDDQAIFTRLTPERAMMEADAAATRIRTGRSRGMLEGIPIAWKDLFDVKGNTTTAGSTVLADQPPADKDAPVVAALAHAGMVCVGQVNMSEFAFSGLGINPHFGTPRNPQSTDVARIPGGSSSGSAVAVAAGLVPVAIGTDTGGSIRIPAAFNGIIGYKATSGRYAMRGIFPLSKTLDSLGPLCHTVQDAIWVDAAMRGLTTPNVRREKLAGRRFVVPETLLFDDAEDGVVRAFEAALERLQDAGAIIRRQSFSVINEIRDLSQSHGTIVAAEAFALHRHRIEGPEAERMDQRVATRTRLGGSISMPNYIELLQKRLQIIETFNAQIGLNEFILTPTVAHVAPPIAPLETDEELFFKTNGKTLRNTAIGNFLNWCGVSMPCGTGDANMPVGLLMSGIGGTDDDLLGLALEVENTVVVL